MCVSLNVSVIYNIDIPHDTAVDGMLRLEAGFAFQLTVNNSELVLLHVGSISFTVDCEAYQCIKIMIHNGNVLRPQLVPF